MRGHSEVAHRHLWRLGTVELLRDSTPVSDVRALRRALRYLVTPGSSEVRLRLLLSALGRSRSRVLKRVLERRLRSWTVGPRAAIWREKRIGWERYRPQLETRELVRTLVLKPPGPNGEKGVLYAAFESTWLQLLASYDLEAILREYLLVAASSSSPPSYPPLLAVAGLSTDPVFVQISNPADVASYEICGPAVRPLPIMACDWINPDLYRPLPHAEREIDILMVAGWARLKGHWLLFEALSRMPRGLRVVLVGQDMEGRTADDVWAEARAYRVSGRIEIVRNATPDLVAELQCNSRALAVLSRREGSGVVTAEAFFADTPVLMLREAHVGSRAYIGPATGLLSDRRHLRQDLAALVERSESYAPRAWALRHITCFETTRRLNMLLRAHALGSGSPWASDIAPMCWRPDPMYADEEDARLMRPAYDDLRKRFGVRFRDPPELLAVPPTGDSGA